MLMIYKNIVPFIELFHKNFLKNRERYKHYITEFISILFGCHEKLKQ